jgi:hypothetical protein
MVIAMMGLAGLSPRAMRTGDGPAADDRSGQASARTLTPVDILITSGTVITMDEDRRVLETGAVAIAGDRMAAEFDAVAMRR